MKFSLSHKILTVVFATALAAIVAQLTAALIFPVLLTASLVVVNMRARMRVTFQLFLGVSALLLCWYAPAEVGLYSIVAVLLLSLYLYGRTSHLLSDLFFLALATYAGIWGMSIHPIFGIWCLLLTYVVGPYASRILFAKNWKSRIARGPDDLFESAFRRATASLGRMNRA